MTLGGQVFLSHSGSDTRAASQLAETLRHNGLTVWLDQDDLEPGDLWIQRLEAAIQSSSAMIVYIGSLGVQHWVDREVRHGLVRSTENPGGFHLIPVLGDGADPRLLPPFLQQHQYVDLRNRRRAPEGIRRLVERLRQPWPEQAISREYWTSHSPFRRLQSFEPDDSWLFFGRDAEIDELLSGLAKEPVLAVVGNSGSGKSSLIRAGLVPALRRGRLRSLGVPVESWRVAVVEPTETPFDYLIEALPEQLAPERPLAERAQFIASYRKRLAADADGLRTALAVMVPRGEHVLLVVDRFEALFASTVAENIQRLYIDALLAASRPGGAVHLRLVIALRADFFGNCLRHGELSRHLAANLYNVQRLSAAGLRETIENRLALAAARPEEGLIELILSDVGDEPGDLALLEATLDELWEERDLPGTLTTRAYLTMGRLRGALKRHADDVLEQIGSPAKRELVKRLFLKLVQLGDGAPDTRRRVSKAAVLQLGSEAQMESLLDQLASSRLIQTGNERGEDYVEVSHEALIREWPVLHRWLEDNREALRFEQRLLEDAKDWQRLKDPDLRLRGTRLKRAEEWLEGTKPAPGPARDFVERSLEMQKDDEESKRQALERELKLQSELRLRAEALVVAEMKEREARDRDLAQQQLLRHQAEDRARDEARAAFRFRLSAIALAGLLILAVALAIYGRHQQLAAESRTLAVQAMQLLSLSQPEALGLAIRGVHIARTREAQLAVAASLPQLVANLRGHSGTVSSIAFSSDGSKIVTASEDGTARVWSSATGEQLASFAGGGSVRRATFSIDGRRVLTCSDDRKERVWELETGTLLATLPGDPPFQCSGSHSADGRQIATVGPDGAARLWSVSPLRLLRTLLEPRTVETAVYSPDSQRILTVSTGTVRVWYADGRPPPFVLRRPGQAFYRGTFSSDGLRIITFGAAGTEVWDAVTGKRLAGILRPDGDAWGSLASPDGSRNLTLDPGDTSLWEVASGRRVAVLERDFGAKISGGEFSRDGRRLMTAGEGPVRIWDATNGWLLATVQILSQPLRYAAFAPDGQRVVTAEQDNTLRVWSLDGFKLDFTRHESGPCWAIAANGERIATCTGDKVRVWDGATGNLMVTLTHDRADVQGAGFSLDGQRILSSSNGTLRVWNATSGRLLATIVPSVRSGITVSATFSPNGQRVLSKFPAQVWDAATGALLGNLRGGNATWSPNSERIATLNGFEWQVWSAGDGSQLAALPGQTSGSKAVFSRDGQSVATYDAVGVQIWNATGGKLLSDLKVYITSPPDFSADGKRMIFGDDEGGLLMWYAADGHVGRVQGPRKPVTAAVFSRDDRRILTVSDDETARIWDAASGRQLAVLQGHTNQIRCAQYSLDGKRILTRSDDHTARAWDAGSGRTLAVVTSSGAFSDLQLAVLSPDGRRILAASTSGLIRVYRQVTLAEIQRLLYD